MIPKDEDEMKKGQGGRKKERTFNNEYISFFFATCLCVTSSEVEDGVEIVMSVLKRKKKDGFFCWCGDKFVSHVTYCMYAGRWRRINNKSRVFHSKKTKKTIFSTHFTIGLLL